MIWVKRILKFLAIVVAIYVAFVALHVFTPDISDLFGRTKFDKEIWQNWEDTESEFKVRWNMIHDLTKNHELIGKSASQIKDLLGTPDWESNSEISYYLGSTGHGINTGSIVFKFEDGFVIDFEVRQG